MPATRHPLLERQLRDAAAGAEAVDWPAFVAHVERAYRDADDVNRALEHELRHVAAESVQLGRGVAAEAEARFRVFLDRLIEGVAITDRAGVIRTANQGLAEIAGAEPGALGGTAIWHLFPQLPQLDPADNAPRSGAFGGHRRLETELRRRDGGLTPVAVAINEFRWHDAPELVWLVYDLGARRRRERQTAETAAALQAILDNMGQGLLMLDRDLRVIAFNQVFGVIFALPAALLATRPPLAAVFRFQAERGDYGEGAVEEHVLHRSALFERRVPFQREIKRPDGRIFELRCNTTPEGGLVATFSDVTERRLAERSALEAAAAAEAANRAKSDFLANMSHELRTPLNAIIGYSEAITARLFGPLALRYAEYARDINSSGQHLLEIINDLLDLSKIEAGRMELSEEPLDLAAAADDALHIMRERAEHRGVSLTLAPAPADSALVGDARAIRQILYNLLSNAIKFTARGGAVTVAIADAEDGGLRLSVTDTGIGMSADEIPKAMEPFGQVAGLMNRRHQGTGLGLPLVKSFAELHQARFAIASAPGAGTAVSIVFPSARRRGAALGLEGDRSRVRG